MLTGFADTCEGGIDGAYVAGAAAMGRVGALGAANDSGGVVRSAIFAGDRGRLAGGADGADGAAAGAIDTTALGFEAAIAAIARGFVNGMTLAGGVDAGRDRSTFEADLLERTGVVNDGISLCRCPPSE